MKDNFVWFIFLVYLVNVICDTSNFEEKTFYTQAILNTRYKTDKKVIYGKYGSDSPKSNKEGFLFHVRDQDWCSSFEKIPLSYDWIALIPVGNCTYQTKIEVAVSYNATAVIFINNNNDEPVYEDNNEKIVSIIINKDNGDSLIDIYNKEIKIYCEIKTGTHYVDKRWKVSRTSVLFVLVSFILLMCISLAWLVFYYVQRFRHIYHSDRKEVSIKFIFNVIRENVNSNLIQLLY